MFLNDRTCTYVTSLHILNEKVCRTAFESFVPRTYLKSASSFRVVHCSQWADQLLIVARPPAPKKKKKASVPRLFTLWKNYMGNALPFPGCQWKNSHYHPYCTEEKWRQREHKIHPREVKAEDIWYSSTVTVLLALYSQIPLPTTCLTVPVQIF